MNSTWTSQRDQREVGHADRREIRRGEPGAETHTAARGPTPVVFRASLGAEFRPIMRFLPLEPVDLEPIDHGVDLKVIRKVLSTCDFGVCQICWSCRPSRELNFDAIGYYGAPQVECIDRKACERRKGKARR